MTDPRVLLHVGFHKAGSSWLEAWLTRHSQVRFSAPTFGGLQGPLDLCREVNREGPAPRLHAISEENLTGGLVFPEGYFYLLLRHQGFHKRASGIPAHQDRIAARLHALFPGAHVLLITRGFAGALRSVYSQVVRMGGDLPFEDFLHEYERQIADWLAYDRVIDAYRRRFGRESVTVLPFEALAEDEANFGRSLECLLGLDHEEIRIGRVLPSLSPLQLSAYARFSHRVLAPVARHLRNYRAMQMYLLYARFIVDRPFADALVRAVFGPRGGAATPEVPASYLERFRGTATALGSIPAFDRYRAAYLLDDAAT
ncbi:MAG: sulfotransferase [Gemmatimonadaceae bacterium]